MFDSFRFRDIQAPLPPPHPSRPLAPPLPLPSLHWDPACWLISVGLTFHGHQYVKVISPPSLCPSFRSMLIHPSAYPLKPVQSTRPLHPFCPSTRVFPPLLHPLCSSTPTCRVPDNTAMHSEGGEPPSPPSPRHPGYGPGLGKV